MGEIFIIDKDTGWWNSCKRTMNSYHNFTLWPFEVKLDTDLTRLEAALKKEDYDCILLSLTASSDKFGLLKKIKEMIKEITAYTPIIAIGDSSQNASDLPGMIRKASEQGIYDFLTKPFVHEKLLLSIDRGLEIRRLKGEIDYLKRQEDIVYDFSKIIARSPVMKDIVCSLKKFAGTDGTLFITGETGTGKSFISGSIHYNSPRRKNPFIKINCANLSETLLESELFGHEKGAFTGADKIRIGRLEQAKGGTVFLDEVGEMSLPLQAKLLRFLEEKKFERVGGGKTIYSDVRIIAATNRKPEKQVSEGHFRQDLYYRLNVLRLHLPPLKERKECLIPLANHLLAQISRDLKIKCSGFTPEVEKMIRSNSWPGNIRELANIIERALILKEGDFIEEKNFITAQPVMESRKKPVKTAEALSENPATSLEEMEKNQIIRALKKNDWFQKDAARQLGLTARALNYKIKKYGITHPRWRRNK